MDVADQTRGRALITMTQKSVYTAEPSDQFLLLQVDRHHLHTTTYNPCFISPEWKRSFGSSVHTPSFTNVILDHDSLWAPHSTRVSSHMPSITSDIITVACGVTIYGLGFVVLLNKHVSVDRWVPSKASSAKVSRGWRNIFGLHTSRLFDCNTSLLQLRYPQWSGAAEVQEKRAFLFGQEGGGDHVVNSGRQMLGLHITETTSEDEEE